MQFRTQLIFEEIMITVCRYSFGLSAKFGIPVRTLQQWEQGISAPPEYLIRMMAYIILLEERTDDNEELTGVKKHADNK